jgi:ribosome-associated protein
VKKDNRKALAGEELVEKIIKAAEVKLAENIATIDLRQQHCSADWFIICQSDTTVQNRAIADEIIYSLSKDNTRPWHEEGLEDGRWVLIDFSDVVVHVMLPELREYYDIESLWSEGKKTRPKEQ